MVSAMLQCNFGRARLAFPFFSSFFFSILFLAPTVKADSVRPENTDWQGIKQ